MKWLGASMLVASWMLCCWTVVAFVLLPWHHLIFRLTPTASAYASRVVIDQQIVRYLVSGNQATLGGLTPLEQAHMVDVRTVWLGFIVYVLLLGIALPIIGRIRRSTSTLSTGTFQAAIRATQRAILVVGAVSLICFGPLFELVHQLFFPAGNWQFAASSALIQTYPLPFFAWAWGCIVLASYVTLGMTRMPKPAHERP